MERPRKYHDILVLLLHFLQVQNLFLRSLKQWMENLLNKARLTIQTVVMDL
jgi:hypothetical protein